MTRVTGSRSQRTKQIATTHPKTIAAIRRLLNELRDLLNDIGLDASRLNLHTVSPDRSSSVATKSMYYPAAVGEILSVWRSDPRYVDSTGCPAIIPIKGRNPSFQGMCRIAVPGIKYRTILGELLRVGAVETTNNRIRVTERVFPVYRDSLLAKQHTLASLVTFVRTLRHNLRNHSSSGAQRFHRVAWNGSLDRELAVPLNIWLKQQGQSFLESADTWMRRASSKNAIGRKRHKNDDCLAVSVGVYLSVDDSDEK
jgi:Family of unknown function (DUF6502)